MNWVRPDQKSIRPRRVFRAIFIALLLTGLSGLNGLSARTSQPATFSSPAEAFSALVEAFRNADSSQLTALLGPSGKALFSAEDRSEGSRAEQFLKDYQVKHRLEEVSPNKVVLHVGMTDWPWPFPVVRVGKRWRFDIDQGQKEILARRIGRNETGAVQVCLAYVDAQQEYAREHHSAEGAGEYAQKFMSDQGKKNGLCWISGKEEKQSPVGPLLANACQVNEAGERSNEMATPYYGYYYKILTGQGREATGGAYSYLVRGRMIGGFALVAYPASYGHSGIMTFMVSQDGVVYEKNLGPKTEGIAKALKVFNPDKSWK
ncbi:MAG TPA: DUF2950 domain-containing protein, partial [Thermodesulfobacteriota bacterium]|nr:DUF2950 domain-containing protein [Thermodesulfobacteriota bacterium]